MNRDSDNISISQLLLSPPVCRTSLTNAPWKTPSSVQNSFPTHPTSPVYVRWILYHKSPNYQLSKARTSPETGEAGKRERKVRHIHELITSPPHDCTEDSCPSALVGHILERSISISLIYIFFLLGNRQTDRYIDIYIYIYMTCMDIIYR